MSFTSAIGLTIETLLLAPAALVYLFFFLKEPVVTMNPSSFGSLALLFFAGVFTAVPLLYLLKGPKNSFIPSWYFAVYCTDHYTLFGAVCVSRTLICSKNRDIPLYLGGDFTIYNLSTPNEKTANSH
ncbi:hypothetical protein OE903_04465 [Bacillus sp. B6(2022)]|nr:hypothetical protein [Bacillus sp. B6(2022)]